MRLLSMKRHLALLWAVCVLFAASTLETGSVDATVEPNQTTRQLTTVQPTVWDSPRTPAEGSVAGPTVLPTVVTEEATVRDNTDSSNGSPPGLVATTAAATSSSGQQLLHTSTAAGEAHLSYHTAQTAEHAEDRLHQQSATTGMTAPATTSAASSATVAASSPQPTSITDPEITSRFSSTTSSDESTQVPVFTQALSSPSASTASTRTTNPTSTRQAAPGFDTTSLPETSKPSTEIPYPSQSTSATSTPISMSQFPDTAGSSAASTAIPTDFPSSTTAVSTTAVSTTAVSTTPAGIPITRVPTKLPTTRVPTKLPTTESAPATTAAPCDVLKSHPSPEVQSCSTRGLAKNCLIVIAIMAVLATIFMVSTIILCTKLSARKYKLKRPQQSTEMMCISALLPEMNYTYTRPRHAVSNGVLVLPSGGDSDEDGGDNLTLSSFLPENDRYV